MLRAKRWDGDGRVRFQSLKGHALDTVEALLPALEAAGPLFARRWGRGLDEIKASAVAVAALHDVGKACRHYQEQAMDRGRHPSRFPHALTGLPVVLDVWERLRLPSLLEYKGLPLAELLAVLGHHSPLYDDLYEEGSLELKCLHYEDPFGAVLDEVLEEAGRRARVPRLRGQGGWDVGRWRSRTTHWMAQWVRRIKGRSVEEEVRSKWGERYPKAAVAFLLGLLKEADIWASRGFEEKAREAGEEVLGPVGPALPPKLDPEEARGRLLASLGGLYGHQGRLASLEDPFCLLLAPCGRGKTEGALLWALGQMERGEAVRIVFVLPTQVTSNAIRERLARLFGEERVGLYHGRSLLEHRDLVRMRLQARAPAEGEDLDSRLEMELARDANFEGECFLRPVTVTTADHILYTFVRGYKQADFALGLLQTAVLVFDEVHAYDLKMLAELRELFRLLRELRIPHLVMSATLPSFLVQEGGLQDYARVEDEEGLAFRPFILRKEGRPLFLKEEDGWRVDAEAVEELVRGHREGRVQFAVVNTVRKARALYRALKGRLEEEGLSATHLLCLHSRLCHVHRRGRERAVMEALREGRRPLLLVATQVVEVSLDISSEVLFTEACPADACAQRGGRLHRGAREPEGHLLRLFPVEDPRPYGREPLERSWEGLQEGEVSYALLREVCDRAYQGLRLGVAGLPTFFKQNLLFGWHPSDVRFNEEVGKAYRPRGVEPTVEVVPSSVFRALGQEALSPDYLVPVPLWWVAHSGQKGLGLFSPQPDSRGRLWLLCHLPYREEDGFEEERLGLPVQGVVVDGDE